MTHIVAIQSETERRGYGHAHTHIYACMHTHTRTQAVGLGRIEQAARETQRAHCARQRPGRSSVQVLAAARMCGGQICARGRRSRSLVHFCPTCMWLLGHGATRMSICTYIVLACRQTGRRTAFRGGGTIGVLLLLPVWLTMPADRLAGPGHARVLQERSGMLGLLFWRQRDCAATSHRAALVTCRTFKWSMG